MIRLGWTPELFGSFDRSRRYGDRGREAHKVERFGKKYQWIAYHELLARVADNYHPDVRYGELRPYDGLYQIHDREIDPSLPPIPFESFVGRDRGAATDASVEAKGLPHPPLVDPNYTAYRGDIVPFNADEESLPIADRVARITDEAGDAWVVLDGGFISRDKSEAGDDGLDAVIGLEQSCWLHSWLVPAADLTGTLEVVAGDIAQGMSSDLVDTHGHSGCCYLGELNWRATHCYHQHADVREVRGFQETDEALGVYDTTETYTWEGNGFDCSIDETVSFPVPSAYVQQSGGLRWDGSDRTWVRPAGDVALVSVGDRGWSGSHLLVARESWLLTYLKEQKLALVISAHGERRRLAGSNTYRHPWVEYSSLVAVTGAGVLVGARSEIEQKEGHSD